MAGAAILISSPSLFSPFPKLLHSHLSSSSNLPFSQRTFHHLRGFRNPKTSICHGKLSGSGKELHEDIEEIFFEGDEDIEDESDDDDDETESSLDLLFRFLQSMFKKVSKRAKKVTRSILPPVIAPQLVSFSVDGVLILTSLSVLKALLEVACTLGGTVFIVILLLRLIWATISHFQSVENRFKQGGNSYGTPQPVT